MPKRRQTVLLCGPARRLLAAVARELARAGLPLVIQAAPAEVPAARRIVAALRGGSPIRIVAAALDGDVASRQLIEAAWKAGSGIDAVVLCVETPADIRVGDADLDDWQQTLGTGLRAPFFVAKHAGLRMRRGTGRLVVAVDGPGRRAEPMAAVVRGGLDCLIDVLARALPNVAVAGVFGGRTGSGAVEIGRTVRILVAEQALPSGTIVDLGARRRG